jgi:uncharacterized protein
MHNKTLHMVAFLVLVVGGLNWLLLGVFQWEIGALFGGQSEIIPRVIYILVGIAAVYELITHKANCKACQSSKGPSPSESMSEPVV